MCVFKEFCKKKNFEKNLIFIFEHSHPQIFNFNKGKLARFVHKNVEMWITYVEIPLFSPFLVGCIKMNGNE